MEWYRPKGDAGHVEQMSHHLLDAYWVSGEWFNTTIEIVSAAVERAMDIADMPRRSRTFIEPAVTPRQPPTPEQIAWAKANPGIIAREILKWHMEK
jgi:hypothetical protein